MASSFDRFFKTAHSQATFHATNSKVDTSTNKRILLELDIANSSTSNTGTNVTVSVIIYDGSTQYTLLKAGQIPYGNTLKVLNGQKIVMKTTDTLHVIVTSVSGHQVDVIGSILDNVG